MTTFFIGVYLLNLSIGYTPFPLFCWYTLESWFLTMTIRCCYITVDSASQNGFCSYKHSIHKKTNIMQIMIKNITFFINLIFCYREIVKLDHFITLSLSYANTVLWCRHWKIHRFVAAPNSFPNNAWEEFYSLLCLERGDGKRGRRMRGTNKVMYKDWSLDAKRIL